MIKKSFLRATISTSVILSHLFCVFFLLFLKTSFTTPAERNDTALLLIPLLSAYVLAIGRRAITGQQDTKDAVFVNAEYVIFAVLITAGFLLAMVFCVYTYPSETIPNIDILRRTLTFVEIGLGAGFGLLVEDMFGRVEKIHVIGGKDE